MLSVMNWCCVAVGAPALLAGVCMVARADEILADIWVTKYALTQGIQHEKAKLEVGGRVALTPDNYFRQGEFELTPENAVNKAEVMRRREINRLQRKIDELNNMKIEVTE